MGRWEPDSRGRLERAAMELYRERGYDQTTVAEIALRAGLTERTFFRYFTDKREVLFSGSARLQAVLVDALNAQPPGVEPIDAVGVALEAAAAVIGSRRDFALQRQAIITANAELQERELIKLATLASALAESLRQRHVAEPAASLTAEAGIAVFKVAFVSWIDDGRRTFEQCIRDALDEMKKVTNRRVSI